MPSKCVISGFRCEVAENCALLFIRAHFSYIAVPVTGLEWPRGFQEVKVPRFHDNGTGWW